MRDNWLKKFAARIFFREGSIRRIQFGPLRGSIFRVNKITGLSPWYSGTERMHQKAFKRVLKKGDVVIDVGANWGLHTLYLSKLVGPAGQVIAVEPYPPAFEELQWHVAANGCRNVHCIFRALAEVNGVGRFGPGNNASTGRLVFGDEAKDVLMVSTCTLDSLVRELMLTRLELVKIDVEGAEGSVLQGSEDSVKKFRPILVIDLHSVDQDLFVGKWLREREYGIERLVGGRSLNILTKDGQKNTAFGDLF